MPQLFDSSTANLLAFFAVTAAVAGVVTVTLAVVFAWRDNHPKYTVRRGSKPAEVDIRESSST